MKKRIVFTLSVFILVSGSLFAKYSKKLQLNSKEDYKNLVLDIASTQFIDGYPLDISVYDDGQMGIYFENNQQYFSGNAKGTALFLNGTNHHYSMGTVSFGDGGGIEFTSISNTMLDPWTIETKYKSGGTNVEIKQITSYINGSNYYKIKWEITNNSSGIFNDLRLIHGGDTYFGTNDLARGHYSPELKMLYLTNETFSNTGIMALYGGPLSPIDHYFNGTFSESWAAMRSGQLSDTFNGNNIDAGYMVQWNKAELVPGETWEIIAYEKWTSPGKVQVYAPVNQYISCKDEKTLSYVIQNFQPSETTYNLSVTSKNGWPVTITQESVTLQPNETMEVLVNATITAPTTEIDTITLFVTDDQNSLVSNSDFVEITPVSIVTNNISINVEVGEHHLGTKIPLRNIIYDSLNTDAIIEKALFSIEDSVTAKYCCCCCSDTLIFGGIKDDILHLNYLKHTDGIGTIRLKTEYLGLTKYADINVNVFSVIPGDTINYIGDTTAFEVALEEEMLPTEFNLGQNYPNPFNPTTLIPFSLPESGSVTLTIYDLNGKIVKTLIAGQLNAGYHKFEIDATKFSTGIYFYRLQAGSFTDIKKMTIIK